MAKSLTISVDLGGTNLRAALVSETGEILQRVRMPSDPLKGKDHVLASVLGAIRELAAPVSKKIRGVVLGFPGIVDPEKGIVYQSPHFPDWKDLDLYGFFKPELAWPVRADNDANLAAMGEAWKGAGAGLKNFVMLTLGTGVGGGIVIEHRVFHGDRGFAGELGHIIIDTEGPECACGGQGCLEMYVSATGIRRLVDESDDAPGRDRLLETLGIPIERLTVEHLHKAALDGDIFSNVIFKKMGYYLGIGLASLVNTLGIESFVLGGGVSGAWDFFIEPAKKELAERTYREIARSVQIHRAVLGDDAALLGGAGLLKFP